jgi:hypothetical protein
VLDDFVHTPVQSLCLDYFFLFACIDVLSVLDDFVRAPVQSLCLDYFFLFASIDVLFPLRDVVQLLSVSVDASPVSLDLSPLSFLNPNHPQQRSFSLH